MSYIDGYVLAVPSANRDAYIEVAEHVGRMFRKHGATRVVECWENDVPDGEHTSFPLAVKRAEGEVVVFSWVEWPDKAFREEAVKRVMEDMQGDPMLGNMPFDGKRMIFGSFDAIVDL